jgi:hypothetical protein
MKTNPSLYHFERTADPNRLTVAFINADLDVALTCAQIARQTPEAEKSIRNRRNARKAYDAVLQYTGSSNLTRFEKESITRKWCS